MGENLFSQVVTDKGCFGGADGDVRKKGGARAAPVKQPLGELKRRERLVMGFGCRGSEEDGNDGECRVEKAARWWVWRVFVGRFGWKESESAEAGLWARRACDCLADTRRA